MHGICQERPVVQHNLIGYNQTTRGSALDTLPSGVVVAQGNLDPLVQVQFLTRQPPQHEMSVGPRAEITGKCVLD